MRRLTVFNQQSLDGYFTDALGDMSFAHNPVQDPEWEAFVRGNASGGGELVFGRVTYELMAGYWPSPAAAERDPVVAKAMNDLPKVVFSKTMKRAEWSNTRLFGDDLPAALAALKREAGKDLVIMGSGSVVAQAARAGLVDEYQLVLVPVALGSGRTLFEGLERRARLRLIERRAFRNGNVALRYAPD
jgi:dihydrofolate reductase